MFLNGLTETRTGPMYVCMLSRMIIKRGNHLLFTFLKGKLLDLGTYEYLVIHVTFAQISDDFIFIDARE